MAFVVEDGTGLEDATAYISVAFLDAYWLDVNVTFTQTETQKQAAIVEATRYIEARWRNKFRGCIVTEIEPYQALSWPRYNVWDHRGLLLPYDEVPIGIQNATAEYAKVALESPLAALQPRPTQDPFVTKEKVGPIEVERLPGAQIVHPVPAADRLIREFVYSGNYAIR